jgi:NitT/TauT family transport system substrate-binding protein
MIGDVRAARPGLTRSRFLAAAATLAGGPALLAAAPRPALPGAPVRIGWSGTSCEAATYVAYQRGYFAREGLDVQLVRLSDPLAAPRAIAAGEIDALSSLLYSWLKPIAGGLDARLTAGLHGGCVRLVAANASPIRELGQIKGATIATDRLNGPAMNFFVSLLRKREIDPVRDVRWHALAPARLAGALERGEADVVAAGDPVGFDLMRGNAAVPITDQLAAGIFYCDRGISHSHNCYVVMRGALVRERPRIAAALTWAWRDATRWVGEHVADAARIAVDNKYVPSDSRTTAALLSTYGWHPSADLAFEEIELTARDFKRAGLLDSRTDPEDLAERVYADILKTVDG